MKNAVSAVIGGYLVIGLTVLLVQWISVAAQSECEGPSARPLWGESRIRVLVRWLPDFATQVVGGDMAVRDYLRAGYTCAPAFVPPPTLAPQPESSLLNQRGDELGSLAAKVLQAAGNSTTTSDENLPAWSLSLEQQQRLLAAADRSRDAAMTEWFDRLSEEIETLGDDRPARAATEDEVARVIEALRRSRESELGIAAALTDRADELPGTRIGWYRERAYEAFIDAMAANQKFIFVVGEDWCDHCNDFVENVLRCPAIERFAGRASFAYGRPSRELNAAKVARELGITKYPSMFFFDPTPEVLWVDHTFIGAVEASEVAARLEEFLGSPQGSEADAWAAAQTPGFHKDPQPMCRAR
jgi:hypothetical protein